MVLVAERDRAGIVGADLDRQVVDALVEILREVPARIARGAAEQRLRAGGVLEAARAGLQPDQIAFTVSADQEHQIACTRKGHRKPQSYGISRRLYANDAERAITGDARCRKTAGRPVVNIWGLTSDVISDITKLA